MLSDRQKDTKRNVECAKCRLVRCFLILKSFPAPDFQIAVFFVQFRQRINQVHLFFFQVVERHLFDGFSFVGGSIMILDALRIKRFLNLGQPIGGVSCLDVGFPGLL